MDPDVALANAREAARQMEGFRDETGVGLTSVTAAVELLEAFEALDEWLTKGGFLPKAWRALHDQTIRCLTT